MELLINGKEPYRCTKDELHQAFVLLKDASNFLKRRSALKFHAGMRVSFRTKRGLKIVGTIKKVNTTTILVVPDDDPRTTWKVSSNLLESEPSIERTK